MAVVAELWRYPVKSMRGERLEETPVVASGIPGDRRRTLARGGRLVTARHDRRVLNQPADRAGDLGYDVVEEPEGLFDNHPLLLVGLPGIAALGWLAGREVDHRRFRANVYLEGLAADEERAVAGPPAPPGHRAAPRGRALRAVRGRDPAPGHAGGGA